MRRFKIIGFVEPKGYKGEEVVEECEDGKWVEYEEAKNIKSENKIFKKELRANFEFFKKRTKIKNAKFADYIEELKRRG